MRTCRYCSLAIDEDGNLSICRGCWETVSRFDPCGEPRFVDIGDVRSALQISKHAAVIYHSSVSLLPACQHDALSARWIFDRDWEACEDWYDFDEKNIREECSSSDAIEVVRGGPELNSKLLLHVLELVPHEPACVVGLQAETGAVLFGNDLGDWCAAVMPLRGQS